jgi:hypothetical protein
MTPYLHQFPAPALDAAERRLLLILSRELRRYGTPVVVRKKTKPRLRIRKAV